MARSAANKPTTPAMICMLAAEPIGVTPGCGLVIIAAGRLLGHGSSVSMDDTAQLIFPSSVGVDLLEQVPVKL